MRGFAFASVLAVLAAPVACRARPTPDECTQMIDRYVEMRLGDDPALAGASDAQAAELREALRAKKKQEPAYARARAQCAQEVSRVEWECAMKAPTPNDWEACVD